MSKIPRLDYDQIASEYNQRYSSDPSQERSRALLALAERVKAQRILEAGCGTGHWLNLLDSLTNGLYGLDFSAKMLHEAGKQSAQLKLTQGSAIRLPYCDNSFDFVYCVDAIHHFGDVQSFIAESFRTVRPGGVLAVVGSDPHSGDDHWYVYDYFDGVLAMDLRRFPSRRTIQDWLAEEGFQDITTEVVEQIRDVYHGRDVLNDPFLKKNATSQLATLSDDAYKSGIGKIKSAIADAESRKEGVAFSSDLCVKMTFGFKPV